MNEETREFAIRVIKYLLALIIIMGILFCLFYTVIKAISICEERNWDGSEWNTHSRSLMIGEGFGEEIKIKCSKGKDIDVIIDLLKELHLIGEKE